jgi:hypothetical protein
MQDIIGPFLAALLDCVYQQVDHVAPLAIARKCLVPGDIAWDNCECGQLVLTEDNRFGSRTLGSEDPNYEAECGEPVLNVSCTISLTRCVPGVSDNGDPPTCDALQIAALQLLKDKNDIRRALMCCLDAAYRANNPAQMLGYYIGGQATTGPTGNCAGSDTIFVLGFVNPCEC